MLDGSKEVGVGTVSHDPIAGVEHRQAWIAVLSITDIWAALAIAVIWFAVLFAAVYGPDIASRGVAGDSTTVPSGVAVALFASVATWAVAKYGFRRDKPPAGR
jgi:hypothetical protein